MQDNQTSIFSLDPHSQHFAELCNALYERSLDQLVHSGISQTSLLKRRLQGLPHHIRSAARFLANNTTPLSVDWHNASWQYQQASRPLHLKHDAQKLAAWLSQLSNPGLPVAVTIEYQTTVHLELDSIDRFDSHNRQVHLNKSGWFDYQGKSLEQANLLLLLPSKTVMAAACCGHQWSNGRKAQPRALSLRELLLSTRINWRNVQKPAPEQNN